MNRTNFGQYLENIEKSKPSWNGGSTPAVQPPPAFECSRCSTTQPGLNASKVTQLATIRYPTLPVAIEHSALPSKICMLQSERTACCATISVIVTATSPASRLCKTESRYRELEGVISRKQYSRHYQSNRDRRKAGVFVDLTSRYR